MILGTAKTHFDQDIQRAVDLHNHAVGQIASQLKDDLLRAAWMISVGAADAFYCDAYADLVARTLRAKKLQASGRLSDSLGDLRIPVVAVLDSTNSLQWRMAARELVEKQSVLSIEEIKKLLNRFCRDQNKLLTEATIESWLIHANARQRHFGLTRAAYNATAGGARNRAKKDALKKFNERIQSIFQRRHDCIHNCDRPRHALQRIDPNATTKAIEDIRFLVERSTDHLRSEYPFYLTDRGFDAQTRNQVGA